GDGRRGGEAAVDEHAELVAADPVGTVVRAELRGEHPRDLAEDGVAPLVAEPLVDPLELVQVAEDEAELAPARRARRDLRLERLVERAPVCEPRQRVPPRLALVRE